MLTSDATQDWYRKYFSTPTPRAQFLRSIGAHAIAKYYADKLSSDVDRQGYILCDELAAAIVLDEKVCSAASTVVCKVDTDGQWTRGQMVVDWNNRTRRPTNARIVTKLELGRLETLLQTAVAPDSVGDDVTAGV